jgi:hypothetical protein
MFAARASKRASMTRRLVPQVGDAQPATAVVAKHKVAVRTLPRTRA